MLKLAVLGVVHALGLLDRYPPTPSSLAKPFIRKYLEPSSFTTEDALGSVFRRKPTFVVFSNAYLWYLEPTAARFLHQELTRDYVLAAEIGSAQIYRRIASPQ